MKNSRLKVFNYCTGYYALGPAASGVFPNFALGPLTYQAQSVDPTVALAQQLQQPQQAYLHAYQPAAAIYQSQLAQLLALRQAQLVQAQQGQLHTIPSAQVGFIVRKHVDELSDRR